MSEVLERLEKLECHIHILNEENAGNKATIKLLDKRLSESNQKIQRLEEERRNSPSGSDVCTRNHKEIKALKTEVARLKQPHEQQIQDASDKFKRVDKLQHLLNVAILKRTTVYERESVTKPESVTEPVKVLQEILTDTHSQMESLTTQFSAFENVSQTFDSRLSESVEKAKRFEGSLNDMQNQMDSLTKKISSIESVNRTSESRLQVSERKANTVDGVLNGLQKRIATNENAIGQIKRCQDMVENTIFLADLGEGIGLATNVPTRLNRCNKLYVGGRYFDTRTAFFTVPADGFYLFTITVEQKEPGQLRVGVGPENEIPYGIVVTYIEASSPDVRRDSRSGSIVMRLGQGQRVCVQATRLEGEAKVAFCRFSACLLSLCTPKDPQAAVRCSVS